MGLCGLTEDAAGALAGCMREMSPADFAETLRSAIREDEWLLVLHGAVLGLCAGSLHLLLFGV
jgi:hypothetical protein